ncbi:MAG: hypothetical protein NTZ72_05125, partial [Afipia sp.]|nr:hypothetical protein [Afipia sp.]
AGLFILTDILRVLSQPKSNRLMFLRWGWKSWTVLPMFQWSMFHTMVDEFRHFRSRHPCCAIRPERLKWMK